MDAAACESVVISYPTRRAADQTVERVGLAGVIAISGMSPRWSRQRGRPARRGVRACGDTGQRQLLAPLADLDHHGMSAAPDVGRTKWPASSVIVWVYAPPGRLSTQRSHCRRR